MSTNKRDKKTDNTSTSNSAVISTSYHSMSKMITASPATGYSHRGLKLCQNILWRRCCLLALHQQCRGTSLHGIQMVAIIRMERFSSSINQEKISHDWWLDSFIWWALNWQRMKYNKHWPDFPWFVTWKSLFSSEKNCWPQSKTHTHTHTQSTYICMQAKQRGLILQCISGM